MTSTSTSTLLKATFAGGAFSLRGQARLRVRNGVAYAAVLQMVCDQTMGEAMVAGIGGRWACGKWSVPAEDQLAATTRLLNVCRGSVVDGVRQVALFRIGQPMVRPGVPMSEAVMALRRMIVDPKVLANG